MSRRPLPVVFAAIVVSVGLAACGGSGGTSTPSAAGSAPPASAAAACHPTTDAGTVAVGIADRAFQPAEITAEVGDIITFTNGDSVGHTASLDASDCSTGVLGNGEAGGLTFDAAGTYPFHCDVHPSMTGTITVS